MLRLSRSTVGLLYAAALLSALSAWDRCAAPGGASTISRLCDLSVRRQSEDSEQEAALRADVLGREQRLQAVGEEVRGGRLGLLDAAARVRDIQSASPHFSWELYRLQAPRATDEELLCRSVISLASQSDGTRTGEPGPVVARLEAELIEYLKRGPIRLP